MIYLTNPQRRFLHNLINVQCVDCRGFSDSDLKIVKYLDSIELIDAKRETGVYPSMSNAELKTIKGKYISVSISEKGKSYFVERRSELIHFLIPVSISIIALLISIISLIMQLPIVQML